MKSKRKYYTMRPELAGVIIQFMARADRYEHPDGKFDHAKRWYSQERCGPLCKGYRSPSRAYPYSALLHCRTAAHVAGLHTDNSEDAQAVVTACRSRTVCQRNLRAIIDRFPPRRRSSASAAMLSTMPMPATLEEAMYCPALDICDVAAAKHASKTTVASVHAWIRQMLTTFAQDKYQVEHWGHVARLHSKLAELGQRVGMTYQCPTDLLAYAL